MVLTASSIFSNEPLRITVHVSLVYDTKAEDFCLVVEPIDNYPIDISIRNYYVVLELLYSLECETVRNLSS